MFRSFFRNRRVLKRLMKAAQKWDAEILPRLKSDPTDNFKWDQIVWQEIRYWIAGDSESKVRDEFAFICDRRGLSDEQRNWIAATLRHVGLVKSRFVLPGEQP